MERVNRNKAPEDGVSWLVDYVCRLLHSYPQFSHDYVWDELPMDIGWVYYGWAFLNDPMNRFAGVKIVGKGYIAQEVERLIDEAHRVWNLKK